MSNSPGINVELQRPSDPDRGLKTLVAASLFVLLAFGMYACGVDSAPEVGTVSSERVTPIVATPSPPTFSARGVQVQTTEKQVSAARDADTANESSTRIPENENPLSSIAGTAHTPVASARTGSESLAPDFIGIVSWINSEPLALARLRGNVVLVDFWTYTCVNCIRTFPYLRDWNEKYKPAGLVIVGVHTPEFEFEKLRDNVAGAIDTFGIKYSVALDNDRRTWNAFRNKVWPGKYLIDKDGYLRYTHLGEGAYRETEQKIRELLAETGADLATIPEGSAPEPQVDPDSLSALPANGLTRELYAGFERNLAAMSSMSGTPYFLQIKYYDYPDTDLMYTDIGERENHFIVLQGLWRNEVESIVHGRATEDYEDYIAIQFAATSVNAVMEQWAGTSYTVRLIMDGVPLSSKDAGADVEFDDEGNSYVLVTEPRMYRLVNLDRFGEHELKLSSNSYEFALFAFTFGDYTGGEPSP